MRHSWNKLTISDREFIAEMAVQLAASMPAYGDPNLSEEYRHDHGQWPFEDIGSLLHELEVCVNDEHTNNNLYKFLSPDEIRTFILSSDKQSGPTLNEVLTTYIVFQCGFLGLPHSGLPFNLSDSWPQKNIEILCLEGYLLKKEGVYQWTDKINSIMRAAGFW